eukprot:11188132-Alexandrium_andersonii.AAC.1
MRIPQIPSRVTLQRWQVHLDMMLMLHSRRMWSLGAMDTCFVHLEYDSSPQAGYDFFMIREV